MLRPPKLIKRTTAVGSATPPVHPGPAKNYLDLYGLSKPPFGEKPESTGYILFDSQRQAFDLLIGHVVNSSGVILLQGQEGVGKTEALRSATTVAAEWGLKAVMVTRPPNGRTSLTQLLSALEGQLGSDPLPGPKGQLGSEPRPGPKGQLSPEPRHGPQGQFRQELRPGPQGLHRPETQPGPQGQFRQELRPGPQGQRRPEPRPGPLRPEPRPDLEGQLTTEPGPAPRDQSRPGGQPGPEPRPGLQDQLSREDQGIPGQMTIDQTVRRFLQPPRKVLLVDDIDLLPEDCVSLLLSLAQHMPRGPSGPAIVLSSSIDAAGKRMEVSQLVSLARHTVRFSRLGTSEIQQYIERCLRIAGGTTRRLIASDAMKLLVARSGGTPGITNRLMEDVLKTGFARGDSMITARTVAAAVGLPEQRVRYPVNVSGMVVRITPFLAAALLVLGASAFLYKGLNGQSDQPSSLTPKPATIAQPAPPPVVVTPQQQAVIAPPEQTAAAKPDQSLSPALLATLMKRGDQSVGLGDIAAARLLYKRAADAGSAPAATALGKTYDPNYAAQGQTPDPSRAAEWYQRAIGLGDAHTTELLKRLGSR
jgi:type II secretory pathway predicted ATPase ExeA